jgi:ribosome-associated protein
MKENFLKERGIEDEFQYKTSRSSGAGGQNVNKLSTKVELRFNISESKILSEGEKLILIERLSQKLTQDGYIIVVSQVERTQLKNRERCKDKFYKIISKALFKPRERILTLPTEESKKKRMESKRHLSEKKEFRKKPF